MLKRGVASVMMLALIFIGILPFVINVKPVKASGTIYIKADGSVDPPTANITTVDYSNYTFTDNNYDSIVIERDNIVVDGAGYTVQGTGAIHSKGIDLTGRSNVTIKNMETKSFHHGIMLSGSNNIISANIITGNRDGAGIGGSWITNNAISGNNITNNMGGIFLQYSSKYNTISGNDITKNGMTGIRLGSFSNNNSICGNIIKNNGEGIRPGESSNYNSICGNIIKNNDDGIRLSGGSNNAISGNKITENNENGILLAGYLYVVSNNIVFGNNITNNPYGIAVYISQNNTIYHNNLINNTQQVYDTGPLDGKPTSTNFWDDGYPSGGNYWGDYAGVDMKSGPNQGQPSSDGIGDTAYVIDAENQDNYPLMNPWIPTETSVEVNGADYPVIIVSNTTIDQIGATANTLNFTSSGPTGEKGYINVIFPMVNTTEIEVFIDGIKPTPPPFPVIYTNGTHYFIYFEFTLSIHNIAIQFAPLEYTLTIHSSPTGVTFTVDSVSHTTPWSGTYSAGASVSYVMPETHDGYVWSHWLEDGDPNRVKTVTMDTDILMTAIYEPAPPPPEPVGGKAVPIVMSADKLELVSPYIGLTILLAVAVATVVYVKKREKIKI